MVKLPTTPNLSSEAIERRTQFMHDLSALLSVWSELEMATEVKIAQLTGMKPLDASIVLGGLQSGARRNILYSLLKERGEANAISKVKAAVSYAKRNALVHSQFASERDFTLSRVYYREVKDAYKVISHDYTAETFHKHFVRFRELTIEAAAAMGVTWDQMREYTGKVRFPGLE